MNMLLSRSAYMDWDGSNMECLAGAVRQIPGQPARIVEGRERPGTRLNAAEELADEDAADGQYSTVEDAEGAEMAEDPVGGGEDDAA
jgi:hypothetical protein